MNYANISNIDFKNKVDIYFISRSKEITILFLFSFKIQLKMSYMYLHTLLYLAAYGQKVISKLN